MKDKFKTLLLWISSMFYKNHGSKILFYHDVYEIENYKALDADICMGTSLELFKKHIKVIADEGYEIVSSIEKEEGQIVIMFDDGFRGLYECKDYFVKKGIKPKVFLVVDYIGKKGFLGLDEIKELQKYGFTFECHTWSHAELTKWNEDNLKRELGDSKIKLCEVTNKDVTEICLPRGRFSDRVISAIKKYKYREIYSSIPGCYCDKIKGVLRPRILSQSLSPIQLKFTLRGGTEIFKRRYIKLHCLDA